VKAVRIKRSRGIHVRDKIIGPRYSFSVTTFISFTVSRREVFGFAVILGTNNSDTQRQARELDISCREKRGLLSLYAMCPNLKIPLCILELQCSYTNPNSLTHGAEPFLRSSQFWSYSKISQNIMEPESSLPCSQEPSTDSYPEPD
jgi:hypothetical protein